MQLAVLTGLVFFVTSTLQYVTEERNSSFPRVITPLGEIEGYYKTSFGGRRFEAYEGIPYAQPPTGELRFKVPKSVLPWSGIMMAKGFKSVCMQYDQAQEDPGKRVTGAEDCLHLNIYTVIRKYRCKVNGISSELLPVIFYIHNGLFQWDSGSNYGPKYLMDQDVTLVTLDYRVGSLGFLSTEDGIVPGNMGLKDQVVALRWVKKNIESFGGNPSSVTVFGQSAGAASTHYHLMSKLSTDLFHRAMLISGSALNSFAQGEGALEKAKKLATVVGCPTSNISKMVDCMRDRPAHRIVESEKEFMLNESWLIGPPAPFGPVVEKGFDDFTFLDRTPIEALTSGKIRDMPVIMGVVSQEGLVEAAEFVTNETRLKEFDERWESIAPFVLDYNYTVPESRYKEVARLVKSHYLGTKKFDKSTVNQTVKLFSDRLLVYHIGEAAMLQARATRNPVRFYKFSYRGAHSNTDRLIGSEKNLGVDHMDDISYVLDHGIDTASTPEDRAMQKWLINVWVSFAKYGTPIVGVEWPRLNRVDTNLNYLHIAGPDQMYMETTRNLGDKFFWKSLGIRENII